ncbi:hypothetical protein QMN58_33030, partial [Escherichia coli]|nr:hypothetical protein [Escherichia coli]
FYAADGDACEQVPALKTSASHHVCLAHPFAERRLVFRKNSDSSAAKSLSRGNVTPKAQRLYAIPKAQSAME